MKKPINISLMAVALAGGLYITGCSSTTDDMHDTMNADMERVQEDIDALPEAPSAADYERERNEVLLELRTLRTEIDEQLAKSNEKLAAVNIGPADRTEEMATQVELIKERDRVDVAIANVEGSATGTWIGVKEEARNTMDDVQAWWTGFKDDLDKKTEVDKDGDGH